MRACIFCMCKITACMGFVIARDFVNKRNPIREVCGKCVLIKSLSELDEKLQEKI